MKRILIFNDSKWRDLPGSVLLKSELEQQMPDAFVQIASFHIWKEAIELFCPHLVVLNHVQGKRNKHIASYVKRHGGMVAVLFNEGILEFTDKIKIFKAQKDNKHVDAFLCWNDTVSELVDGITVGCPRFDIYGKDSHLIDSKELFCDKWGIDPRKKIVLFGDSWPSAKFTYSMQSFHRDNWQELGNTEADKWYDADGFAKHQWEQQNRFKSMINLFSLSMDDLGIDIQIIVKSHPMSDFHMWDKWSDDTGIRVIHSEYSFNALNACDVYITKLGSITVAEAWRLDKNVIKLIDSYKSASSLDQHKVGPPSLRWDKIDDMSEVFAHMVALIAMGHDTSQYVERRAYLNKWGINSFNSSTVVAHELTKMVHDNESELRYTPNLQAFSKALFQHDLMYSSNILDGFGNWDKTTLQRDVKAWNV